MTTYDLGKVVGENGQDGDDGNGIVSIEKTGTSGLVDTYTITYTDGDTDTFTVTNGSSATVDIVTSWNSTTSDAKVPSEKLAKTSLDGKLDNAISSTAVSIASSDNILITDYSDSNKVKRVANILATQVKDSNAHINIGSSASDTQGTINTNIDTALSNKVSKSNTSGLLKNDGTVDTTSYSTFSGSYSDLSNKPSIPSSSSDLSDGSDLVKKSSTSGLLKNDGSVMTGGTGSTNWAIGNHTHSNYISTSSTTGLVKNDGSIDTNTYLTSSAISGMLTTSDVVDNLTSTSATAPLSAKQGKVLNDLIGQAIAYINQ